MHVVIHRLNNAFDGAWSFEVTEHIVENDEIQVLGKLSAEGVTKMQFGASRTNGDGAPDMSLGDHLKAASSDSLRKCARSLPLGRQRRVGRTVG